MQCCKPAERVFEDSLHERDPKFLLGKPQEVLVELFEDKHRLLWDSALQEAEMGTAAHRETGSWSIRATKTRECITTPTS
jgi:hypothetical protein